MKQAVPWWFFFPDVTFHCWCDFSVSPPCHGDDVTFPAWCDLSTVLVAIPGLCDCVCVRFAKSEVYLALVSSSFFVWCYWFMQLPFRYLLLPCAPLLFLWGHCTGLRRVASCNLEAIAEITVYTLVYTFCATDDREVYFVGFEWFWLLDSAPIYDNKYLLTLAANEWPAMSLQSFGPHSFCPSIASRRQERSEV